MRRSVMFLLTLILILPLGGFLYYRQQTAEPIKVGILHSQSGTALLNE